MASYRLSSEVQHFPYGYPKGVCYFTLALDSEPVQCTTRAEIRAAVVAARGGKLRIFAAWPGEWKTDLFLIDDIEALAVAVRAP